MDKLILLTLSIGLTACSSLQRSNSSGYGYTDEVNLNSQTPKNYFQMKRLNKVDRVKKELGYENKSMLSEAEQRQLKLRLMLVDLEDRLETQAERQQYFKLKPYFKNDVERIRFLSLPSADLKRKWIQAKSISADEEEYSEQAIQAIEENDIILGMTKNAVKESWGDPDYVEVAGDKIYGNERWTYLKYVS